ncbi:hypothetical protein [Sphingopyxis sp. KK2]|uniref:hypothetical protein n=1 Tax=Sphingopyxis sp. KK2 TaxID=1855727 RepID=UPI00097E5CCF|nr:hypothetical protein [Sphingopyxis sp. KK2]
MSDDRDVWNQLGTLTRAYDEQDGSEVPPLESERPASAPLRDILGEFVAALPAERERYSLVLDNGQAFSADAIEELLTRADSPFPAP